MIVGTGIDVVAVRRIKLALDRWGDQFSRKILNEAEVYSRRASGQSSRQSSKEAAWLSRQFAAKEAVSKALGTGMRGGVHFRDIIVLRSSLAVNRGAPEVQLANGALSRARQLNIDRIHLSIADEADYAVAHAIAESQRLSSAATDSAASIEGSFSRLP